MKMLSILAAYVIVMWPTLTWASCVTKNGNLVDQNYSSCLKSGNRYEGHVDGIVLKELSGLWAYSCNNSTVRVMLVGDKNSEPTSIKDSVSVNVGKLYNERSVVDIARIGGSYRVLYKSINREVYSEYIFGIISDGVIQLFSLTELDSGNVTENVSAGVNLETGKYLPRLTHCTAG